jgi:hypothetical protein
MPYHGRFPGVPALGKGERGPGGPPGLSLGSLEKSMRSGIEAVPKPPSRGRLALMPQDTIGPPITTGRMVARLTPFKRQELGVREASRYMYQQDKVWARYSSDEVDVGDTLTTTLRTLSKALPLEAPLSALSIGTCRNVPPSCGMILVWPTPRC